jgi:hypothetical protein
MEKDIVREETNLDVLPLNIALMDFILDPKSPINNFILGLRYDELGHTASAASYYLRTAELSSDDLLSYEALLRLSICFQKQGSRNFTVTGVLLRAISLIPSRPEAYFLLSRIYALTMHWQESYTWAVLGDNLKDNAGPSLMTNVEYPGAYVFTFQKAVAGWFFGLFDEAVYLFRQLDKNPNMSPFHREAVKNNLKSLAINWKDPIPYDESLYERLKIKFNHSASIKNNYSQCYQDMFVLSMLNGKTKGTFLEIGCGHPFFGNNTALLEKDFEWKGISIDIDKETMDMFSAERKSRAICKDATKIDYEKLLSESFSTREYDYLQIDCDPAIVSYQVLLKIPFETHRFAVITFEHDFYANEKNSIREKSRKYLESHGYELIASNIAPDKYNSYEDWWIQPTLVDRGIVNKMRSLSETAQKADEYMLNKY